MVKVDNIDIIEHKIGRWHPGDLAIVTKFSYMSITESSESKFIIESLFQKKDRSRHTWPSKQGKWYFVIIQFTGISNLNITGIGDSPKQVMGFDILDISNQGWEGINFHIEDYEDGVIEFYCKNIRILSVEKYHGNKEFIELRLRNDV